MESYKLVNSEEVRGKAERLGYVDDNTRYRENDPFFFTHEEKGAYQTWSDFLLEDQFKGKFEEITQKDFLALPEPLKVGDYIFTHKTGEEINIRKVHHINDEVFISSETFVSGGVDFYYKRKLTDEQIKILEMDS